MQSRVVHVSHQNHHRHRRCAVTSLVLVQGYIDAARAFQQEARIDAGPSDETADVRMFVRSAVEEGKVDEAIERVNDLNPEVRTALRW